MTGKFVTIAVILCVCHLAFADDLEQQKKLALKKIEESFDVMSYGYKNMSNYFNNRVVYLSIIKEQKVNLGQSLNELYAYEINRGAEEYKQKSEVLSSPPKVNECIKEKNEKALKKLDTVYTKGFVQPLENLRGRARDKEQDVVRGWHYRYHASTEEFMVQLNRAKQEVINTKNKVYIKYVMQHFEKVLNQTMSAIYSLPDLLHENEIKFDRTIEKGLMHTFRTTGRKIIDDLQEEYENCFIVI